MKKEIFTAITAVLISAAALSAADDAGTESIFSSGLGSRAASMAGAFSALSDDSSAVYYNPAGLVFMGKQQASFLHYQLYEGAYYNSVSYGQPILDFGTVGAALCRVYAGGIKLYDENDLATGESAYEELKLSVSYAKRLSQEFSLGGTVNIVNIKAMSDGGYGAGADIGLMYEPFDFLRLSLTAHNIVKPSVSLAGSKEDMPQDFVFGAMYRYRTGDFTVNVTADLAKNELVESFRACAGLEASAFGIISLRAGIGSSGAAFGAGVRYMGVSADFAYQPQSYLGGLSRFTLSYDFGLTLEEQKVEREKALKEQVKQLVEQEFRKKEADNAARIYASARDLFSQEKFEDASDEVERALAWSKDYGDALKLKELINKKLLAVYYDRALAAYQRGDYVASLEDFRNAYAIDRGYKDASGYIGRINEKMEMKSGAKELFTKGVELYVNRQYEDALTTLKKALSVEPDNAVIKTYISKANAQLKKASGAKGLTDEQAENVNRLYTAGLKLYTAGDLKGAISSWKEAIAINPGDIKVLKSIEKAQAELTELQKRGIK